MRRNRSPHESIHRDIADVIRRHRGIRVEALGAVMQAATGRTSAFKPYEIARWAERHNLSVTNGYVTAAQGAAGVSWASGVMASHEAAVCGVDLVSQLLLGLQQVEMADGPSRQGSKEADLYLAHPEYGVLAVEVELTQKSTSRYQTIFGRHEERVRRGDYAGVVYLCGTPGVAHVLERIAETRGISKWQFRSITSWVHEALTKCSVTAPDHVLQAFRGR